MDNPNPTYGVVDQRTLGSYNRALHRLRDRHNVEFKQLLKEERIRDSINTAATEDGSK